jgi:hypothetical protein
MSDDFRSRLFNADEVAELEALLVDRGVYANRSQAHVMVAMMGDERALHWWEALHAVGSGEAS